MNDFFRTAVYFKNVPSIERVARVGLAAALVVLPLLWPMPGLWASVNWASAAGLAATGFIGFCPACYLVGRNPVPRRT